MDLVWPCGPTVSCTPATCKPDSRPMASRYSPVRGQNNCFQEAIPTMIQLQIVLLLLLRRRRTPLSIQQWGNLRLRQQLRVLSLSLHSHQTRQLLPLSRNKGKSSLAFFSVDAKILSLGVYTESDSDIEQLEACLHLPPSTPTLWFRLPQSLLSTHNKELAAAS